MTEAVLADAQFSVARVFRPFSGFEARYQGQPLSRPIAIPGDLDQDAGKPGYSPNLLSGIKMPLGAKALLWIPSIFNVSPFPVNFRVQPYRYTLIWRMRNLQDFRTNRTAYHFARQSAGTDNLFVVPSAGHGTVYESTPQSVSAIGGGSTFLTKRTANQEYVLETVTYNSAVTNPPFTPPGAPSPTGAFQQGLAQGNVGSNNTVTFNVLQVDVLGDELMILVDRESTGVEDTTWDFTDPEVDGGFSSFYGTDNGAREAIRDMGVYVFTGSNP